MTENSVTLFFKTIIESGPEKQDNFSLLIITLKSEGFFKEDVSLRGCIFFAIVKSKHCLLLILFLLFAGLIFGHFYQSYQKQQAIQTISWSVAGKVIVVDPGHGGRDPGAIGANGALEKNINLELAKCLKNLLLQAGAVVIMTREGDYDLTDPGLANNKKSADLKARVDLVRKCEADICVSIHVNSFPSSRWWGAQTFYYTPSNESKRLASLIQDELLRLLGNSGRWIKPEDFYIIREVKIPAVLVEVGFISNPQEEQRLKTSVYQEKTAWCIYAGIVRYFAGDEEIPGK